ncbi:magnesium transporter [Pedobacter steynii]|uniref:Magnesium transporter n=1 Tax=Pedobacter steynii TaxID=430522 RepID=A0A1G9P9W8_9SPHI|nr:CorA family divalent cation transporter [Pedobacter steynii]NQX39054.1 magnesium transporter CorA [Pedobacter steynii]SDL95311.1 magnesium transporter [Pedobacter steynii]
MLQHITGKTQTGFEWIDIYEPSEQELKQIIKKYDLHPALVNDCLQPDHLPKYERMPTYSFIIFRIHTEDDMPEADKVQQMTHKIAIFYSDQFIITIHRKKQRFLDHLISMVQADKCNDSQELLNILINDCLNTYEAPLAKLSKAVDYFEEVVFLRPKKVPLLKGLYYLKRKIDLIRRMLILSFEIIDALDADPGNVNTRDTRDHYVKLQNMLDSLAENIHQLLNIYFSASSQRTNDTMRILTIFSVFFMPLTFIVGIYGMNFEFMPELKWKLGYPGVMLLMAVVTLFIYLWFKRKNWL